jgi:hypothetical protein
MKEEKKMKRIRKRRGNFYLSSEGNKLCNHISLSTTNMGKGS